jgi:spore coat polysaccharide biosynthesis predicted glycosyltransferase SpsG
MFALCIESSHQRGMGHLFRALNLLKLFQKQDVPVLACLNNHKRSIELLRQYGVEPVIVSLTDFEANWESRLIKQYGIKVWVNDRLDTDIRHALHVKDMGAKLATFDDRGTGAQLADIHFAPLSFDEHEPLQGKLVFRGADYLILSDEINRFKRKRTESRKLVVTLGGSDTYGVTIKVVEIVKRRGQTATVIVGPGFEHHRELAAVLTEDFTVRHGVPSLIEEFGRYDVAVTGGGITAFEAAASGLPSIIVANELFEIPAARYLESIGASVFAGYHASIDECVFGQELDVSTMSDRGMAHITTCGARNVAKQLMAL